MPSENQNQNTSALNEEFSKLTENLDKLEKKFKDVAKDSPEYISLKTAIQSVRLLISKKDNDNILAFIKNVVEYKESLISLNKEIESFINNTNDLAKALTIISNVLDILHQFIPSA